MPFFDDKEKRILAIAQDNLPLTLTPFADMARECGATEDETLKLLASLKAEGVIRRFGASVRHQRAGWAHNEMVAWKALEMEAEIAGGMLADNPRVSHAYYRPSSAPDWPYEFYTMVHGRDEADCERVIQELAEKWPLKEYARLRSLRELKKTSMRYFEGRGDKARA
ncbi:MAG: Lrp/AsnC family transcriptional regulator [Desulfovibrio sp.]|nr:Lrp/AsnC family transcriptional regulator [Desulfovibrio sp.]